MADIDLDAIEARHVAAVMGTGKVGSSAADVPALVALVRAKQSWIDGAKVDLDGYADDQAEYEVAVRALTAERDEARAAIAAVEDLCNEWQLNAAAPTTRGHCADVVREVIDHARAALDVRHDPSATTDVARVERGE